MDPLTEILHPERPTAIVDIGANPIDGDPPYKAMLARGLCDVVGFEPQAEALARLNQLRGPRERYFPYALGDGHEQKLHICALEGMTSLLLPDPAHLALFDLLPNWGEVKNEISLTTKRLDDVAEITAMDFLKMDIQGSELNVLEHGRRKLAETVVIQTEVSFITLYDGQRPFGEMDLALREFGFLPHRFAELKVWPLMPTVIDNKPRNDLHQLLEADLVYVRDFTRSENMTGEQWKHLALVAHHCYGSSDLALRAVVMAAQLGAISPDAPRRYETILNLRLGT